MKKTLKEREEKAQEMILNRAMHVIYDLEDIPEGKEREDMNKSIEKFLRKLEKQYGYIEGSWLRG